MPPPISSNQSRSLASPPLDNSIFLQSKISIPVLVYRATEDNELFTGEESIEKLASIIAYSAGPSGKNTEYLFKLHEWYLKHIPNQEDDHLNELVEATKKILKPKKKYLPLVIHYF